MIDTMKIVNNVKYNTLLAKDSKNIGMFRNSKPHKFLTTFFWSIVFWDLPKDHVNFEDEVTSIYRPVVDPPIMKYIKKQLRLHEPFLDDFLVSVFI